MKNKFESINSSKFKQFEKNKIDNILAIKGGARTTMSSTSSGMYDDAVGTGTLGTSSGDWSDVKWHER